MQTEWKLTLILDSETRRKLSELSIAEDRSMAWIIRKLINDQYELCANKISKL